MWKTNPFTVFKSIRRRTVFINAVTLSSELCHSLTRLRKCTWSEWSCLLAKPCSIFAHLTLHLLGGIFSCTYLDPLSGFSYGSAYWSPPRSCHYELTCSHEKMKIFKFNSKNNLWSWERRWHWLNESDDDCWTISGTICVSPRTKQDKICHFNGVLRPECSDIL